MGENIVCALCKKTLETYYKNSTSDFPYNTCKHCTMKEYGPSYDDIRNCNHKVMSLEENKRLLKKNPAHICECEYGERGWTDNSGKRTLVPGRSVEKISKKGKKYWGRTFFMQYKVVHTKRWDNIEQLKKKHGNKARSSLRISKNVIKMLKSKPGPHRKGGRKKDKDFDRRDFIPPPLDEKGNPKWTGKILKGNSPYGNAHSLRRQIFLLFHEDPKYLKKLLYEYLEDKSKKDIFDENRGEELQLVTVWMPILERATDELIDKIVNCDRNSEVTKYELLKHPLLKDRTKWRYTLCRLVELRFIHEQKQKGIKKAAQSKISNQS